MGSIPGPETKIPHAVGQVSPLAATTEPEHHSYRKPHCSEDPTGLRWDPTKPKIERKNLVGTGKTREDWSRGKEHGWICASKGLWLQGEVSVQTTEGERKSW